MFRGPAAIANELAAALSLIDKPVSQISTQVLVCELSRSASRDLGLDWAWARGRFGALLPLGAGLITQGTSADGGPLVVGGGGSIGEVAYQGVGRLDKQFFASLKALEDSGQVQIEAAPTVLCRNGEQAQINVRRVTNFLFTQGFDAYGRPILGKSDISADITLTITPTVTSSGLIVLETQATVGSFVFKQGSSLPDVTTRDAKTTVALRDGETLVIGGLKQTETERSVSKTPILGDLPLIGSLFRRTHRGTRESILTVLITPHVVEPRDMAPSLGGDLPPAPSKPRAF